MLVNPKEFGRKLHPQFVAVTSTNELQVSGAMVQHVFAKGIHDALSDRGMSVLMLSECTGLNYQRLTRMLRGSILMRLSDIGMIARAVPQAFDSVVGKYDPRTRWVGKSRLQLIYEAARPLSGAHTDGMPGQHSNSLREPPDVVMPDVWTADMDFANVPEMFPREEFRRRVRELEEALRNLDPTHPLLPK